jgi:hypothetical protein
MEIQGVVGVIVVAILGVAVWCGVLYFIGWEHALIAWGIGAAVGYAAYALGGAGVGTGVLCAALTLLSILTGKIFVHQIYVNQDAEAYVKAELTKEVYGMWIKDAEDLAGVQQEGYRAFMVSHQFTVAENTAAITEKEIADFVEYDVPRLQSMNQKKPTYDQWYEEAQKVIKEERSSSSAWIEEDLHLFDALSALLGVVTAFVVGRHGKGATVA